jgi:hypothetical protein
LIAKPIAMAGLSDVGGVDDEHQIDIKGRDNHKTGYLHRGPIIGRWAIWGDQVRGQRQSVVHRSDMVIRGALDCQLGCACGNQSIQGSGKWLQSLLVSGGLSNLLGQQPLLTPVTYADQARFFG